MSKKPAKPTAREVQLETEVAKLHRALAQREHETRYLRERLSRLDLEPDGHRRTCALHTVLVDLGYDVSRRILHEAGYDPVRALDRLAPLSADDAMERARLDMVRVWHNDPSLTLQSPVVQPFLKRTHTIVGSEWERRETCPRCDGVGSSKVSLPVLDGHQHAEFPR